MNNKKLTYSEFVSRNGKDKLYNNFIGYWTGGIWTEIVRETFHYKKFKEENPCLDKKLSENLKGLSLGKKKLEKHEKDLYEAYLIMNSYGISNEDLFT